MKKQANCKLPQKCKLPLFGEAYISFLGLLLYFLLVCTNAFGQYEQERIPLKMFIYLDKATHCYDRAEHYKGLAESYNARSESYTQKAEKYILNENYNKAIRCTKKAQNANRNAQASAERAEKLHAKGHSYMDKMLKLKRKSKKLKKKNHSGCVLY